MFEGCGTTGKLIEGTNTGHEIIDNVNDTIFAVLLGLVELILEAHRLGVPVALWAEIPCTGGSQMQNANVARFGVTAKLRGHWNEFRQLWTRFQPLAEAVHSAGGLVAIEWPLRCKYWHDPRVERLLKKLHTANATAAACMYGLRPQRDHSPNKLIGKEWRISASCADFAAALHWRCDGSHQHVPVAGCETAATAFYPKPFAEAVHTAIHQWAKRCRESRDHAKKS